MIRRTNDKQTVQLSVIISMMSCFFPPQVSVFGTQNIVCWSHSHRLASWCSVCVRQEFRRLQVPSTLSDKPFGARHDAARQQPHILYRSHRDSPVFMANRMIRASILDRSKVFSSYPYPPPIQTSSGAHRPSNTKGTREFCIKVKAAGD